MDTHRRKGSGSAAEFCIYRQKGGTPMRCIKHTLALLKKHRLFNWVAFELLMIGVVILTGVWTDNLALLSFVLTFVVMIAWDIADAEHRENAEQMLLKQEENDKEMKILLGENERLNSELTTTKSLIRNSKDNPIKSNRLVGDKTFAVRLKAFVNEVNVNDPCSYDEQEYLLNVAERLLKWQTKTVKEGSEEHKYLERIGLLPEPSPNTEEHPVAVEKEMKPRRRPSFKKKTKTSENENKD
jgi:hypothetical protein